MELNTLEAQGVPFRKHKNQWANKNDSWKGILRFYIDGLSIELTCLLKQKKAKYKGSNQPNNLPFKPRKNQHTTPGHPRSKQKFKVGVRMMQVVPKQNRHNTRCVSGPKCQWIAISLISQDLRRISPVEGWCPRPVLPSHGFFGVSPSRFQPVFFLNNKHMGKTTRRKESLRVLSTVFFESDSRSMVWWVFSEITVLYQTFWIFLLLFSVQEVLRINVFTSFQDGIHHHQAMLHFTISFSCFKSINWMYPPTHWQMKDYKDKPSWNYNPGGDCGWFGSVGPRYSLKNWPSGSS